jgi:hypothetical protein
LVERGGVWTVDPRVLKDDLLGAVGDHLRKVASLEERLIEAEVDDEVKSGVDIHVPGSVGTMF